MKNKIIFLLLFATYITNAQVQNYNWYFGRNMAMSWKESESNIVEGMFGTPNETLSDLPKYLDSSVMTTHEGCFTISDYNGDLIVYSDGSTVYNKNNAIVPNGSGLGGNSSSAQSGTIVPYPFNLNKYIVLSLNNESKNQLYYSVLQKIQNSDNYEISPTKRKIQLTGNKGLLGETVTAGKHSNKNDIWILAVGRGNNATDENNLTGHPYLNVWRLYDESSDNNNIQHEIVTTLDLGNQGIIGNNNPNGYIRFTNDSRHFVWVNFGIGGNTADGGVPFICYGDFNNTTGVISNVRIKRGITEAISYGYGVEFTNDNKYVYVTLTINEISVNSRSALLVYDFEELLQASTQTEIDAIAPIYEKRTPIGLATNQTTGPFYGAIQTGPDGRMYIASILRKEVLIIDNPKNPENLRIYKYKSPFEPNIFPTGYNSKGVFWGLPNFAVPWYNTAIEIEQPPSFICIDKELNFNLYTVDGHGFDRVVKMVVDYGDESPTKEYTGTEIIPGLKSESHTYTKTGKYRITVNSYDNNNQIMNTTTKTIIVNSCAIKVNPFLRGEIE